MDYHMKSREQIKELAKARLMAYRSPCVGVYVITAVASLVLGCTGIGALILMPVIMVAASGFFAAVFDGEDRTINDWFSTMFDGFLNKWLGVFLVGLFTFLWSLLFVIPGIVMGIAYSMTPYILAECPNMKAMDALQLSRKITKGYKMDLFVAALSFFGWELLSAFTFGILEILYVGPYRELTFGGIYRELKRNAIELGTVREEEFDR